MEMRVATLELLYGIVSFKSADIVTKYKKFTSKEVDCCDLTDFPQCNSLQTVNR